MHRPILRMTIRQLMIVVAVLACLIGAIIEFLWGASPRAALAESPTFNFGQRPQWSSGAHDWTIRNRGRLPLEVGVQTDTSRCKICMKKGYGESEIVPPGGRTKIRIQWEIGGYRPPKYAQTVILHTNDPSHPTIRFTIE